MYGHISQDGIVGELFDEQPPCDRYHESFYKQIVKLPEGVGTGWCYGDGEWIDPLDAGRAAAGEAVRTERCRLLDRCDLVDCNASNWELMDAEEKAAWYVYKQALRDVTEQTGFPYNIVWPAKPDGFTLSPTPESVEVWPKGGNTP